MGKIIEGFWDCPYCGQKLIKGRELSCPICGRTRDNSTRFYMTDIKNYVSEEHAKNISKNPDWLCSYCDSYNSSTQSKCRVCGHERDSEDGDYFYHQQKNIESKLDSIENTYNISIPKKEEVPVRKTPNKKKTNKYSFLKFGGIALLTFAIIYFLCFLLIPKEAQMRIDDMFWAYNISIEELKTVEESDWDIPPGGRLLRSQEEIYEYQQILDHYETKTRTYDERVIDGYETIVTGHKDLGNGYFEEITTEKPIYKTVTKTETYEEPVYVSVPIYKTKYYYEIDKWIVSRNVKTSEHDKKPYWGEVILNSDEREGSKTEKYSMTGIILDDKKEEHSFDVSKEEWLTYNVGDELTVKVNKLGMVEIVG